MNGEFSEDDNSFIFLSAFSLSAIIHSQFLAATTDFAFSCVLWTTNPCNRLLDAGTQTAPIGRRACHPQVNRGCLVVVVDFSPKWVSGLFLVCLVCLLSRWAIGQSLVPRPATESQEKKTAAVPTVESHSANADPVTMPMSVEIGIPLKIALDSDVRIRRVGQTIHGRTVEPIYDFDKLLVPLGTQVNGRISAIDSAPAKTRVFAATDGNFSPVREVHVQFDELVMSNGRQLKLHTATSPAPDGVLQFVSANEKTAKKSKVERAASKQVIATQQQVRQQWQDLQKQIHAPGKMHKLERIALAQLPLHPQYIDAGTTFNAELLQPLDFGTETLNRESLIDIGSPPPDGSVVRARLITPLTSATAKSGDLVEAMITQPLSVSDHLILPEGSLIKGLVLQAHPARRFGHNGQLRILFHQVLPPDGVAQKVETNLEGVAVAKGEHLKLDAEGGAEVTTPRTRYLTTSIAVALAATQAAPDRDAGQGNPSVGEAGGSAANGASGFHLVGMVVSLAAGSRVVSAGFGSYGAAMSIYHHFLARGREVVYPKNMAMVIGLGTRASKAGNSGQ